MVDVEQCPKPGQMTGSCTQPDLRIAPGKNFVGKSTDIIYIVESASIKLPEDCVGATLRFSQSNYMGMRMQGVQFQICCGFGSCCRCTSAASPRANGASLPPCT